MNFLLITEKPAINLYRYQGGILIQTILKACAVFVWVISVKIQKSFLKRKGNFIMQSSQIADANFVLKKIQLEFQVLLEALKSLEKIRSRFKTQNPVINDLKMKKVKQGLKRKLSEKPKKVKKRKRVKKRVRAKQLKKRKSDANSKAPKKRKVISKPKI